MKALVALAIAIASVAAQAHEDRFLTITKTGEVAGLPKQYGRVMVLASRNAEGDFTSFSIKNQRFNVRLNQCVLRHLRGITELRASGSWYHDLRTMPAYVSINFIKTRPSGNDYSGTGTEITFSLTDGQILMAQRKEKSLFGSPRGKVMQQAASCKDWQ